MIKVSVLYPNIKNADFDIDYYCNQHVPMVIALLSPEVKSGVIEKGIAGSSPGEPPSFLAMGHLYFENVEAFQTSFGRHAERIMADIPNYTNTQPVIQISEVLL